MYKAIQKVTLNGTEGNWYSWYNTSNDNIGFYNYLGASIYKQGNTESQINNRAFCNYFSESTTKNDISNGVVEKYKICGNNGDSYLAIGLAKTKLSDWTTKANAIASFKTWLSNNNVIVYYVLQTPTYTEITDTYLLNQLNGILDMQLYENLCYVDWVGIEKPTMSLQYNKDVYINLDLGVQDFTLENGENYTIDTQGLKLILKSNDSIVYEGTGRYVYT